MLSSVRTTIPARPVKLRHPTNLARKTLRFFFALSASLYTTLHDSSENVGEECNL